MEGITTGKMIISLKNVLIMQTEATDNKLSQDDNNNKHFSSVLFFPTRLIFPAFSHLRFSFTEVLSVDYMGTHGPKKNMVFFWASIFLFN